MNNKYIYWSVMTNVNNSDIYWQLRDFNFHGANEGIKKEQKDCYTSICYNQNGFKKFIKDLDQEGYLLSNIQSEMCFSKERYPSKYPCTVQIWHHFEGSMVYVDIKYYIPILKLYNYSGNILVFKENGNYYMYLASEDSEPNTKESVKITKDMFLYFIEKSKE